MKRLKLGNYYTIKTGDIIAFAQYMGREEFSCCVCGKGHNTRCFNIPYGTTIEEIKEKKYYDKYETWGFGVEHFPEILEDLGRLDK